MIDPAEIVIISRPCVAIRSQRISTAGQDTFIARCTVTGSQFQETQDIKVFHEFLFRDNPCCRGTGKPSPLVIIGKYGRAVVTERNSQNVTVLKRIVQTAEERKLVTPSLPRAQIGPLKIGCRTNVVILIHVRREIVPHHVVRSGSSNVISRTHNCIQVMTVSDILVEGQILFNTVVIVECIGETTIVILYLCRQFTFGRTENLTILVCLVHTQLYICFEPRQEFHFQIGRKHQTFCHRLVLDMKPSSRVRCQRRNRGSQLSLLII